MKREPRIYDKNFFRLLSKKGKACSLPWCLFAKATDITVSIDVAHWDGDVTNNRKQNLVYLCRKHHVQIDKSRTKDRLRLEVKQLTLEEYININLYKKACMNNIKYKLKGDNARLFKGFTIEVSKGDYAQEVRVTKEWVKYNFKNNLVTTIIKIGLNTIYSHQAYEPLYKREKSEKSFTHEAAVKILNKNRTIINLLKIKKS